MIIADLHFLQESLTGFACEPGLPKQSVQVADPSVAACVIVLTVNLLQGDTGGKGIAAKRTFKDALKFTFAKTDYILCGETMSA